MTLLPKNSDKLIQKIKERPLVIYGMGYVGHLIAAWCEENNIAYIFADRRAGTVGEAEVAEVILPDLLKIFYLDANIVVASINYYEEIRTSLKKMGFPDCQIFPYLLFWTQKVPWEELEQSANWEAVRKRAEIFAMWIDNDAKSVADYSIERNFLKEFLTDKTTYYAPKYFQIQDNYLIASFNEEECVTQVDVSSCLAVLMSFKNPEDLIQHICDTTKKTIILSYVTLNKLPDIRLRKSINYVNDFTEQHLIDLFAQHDFFLQKQATDPFDEVHTVYLFRRKG